MIKRGDPLGHVLVAGDWKHLAVLRYVAEDGLDPDRALDIHMEASDNEDSDAEVDEEDKSDDG